MLWKVFKDEAGKELCAYTMEGTFPGEEQATKELLAAEHGKTPEQITVTLEQRRN